jgi:hypothetical protein
MAAMAIKTLEKKLSDLTNDLNGGVKDYYLAMSKFSKSLEKVPFYMGVCVMVTLLR